MPSGDGPDMWSPLIMSKRVYDQFARLAGEQFDLFAASVDAAGEHMERDDAQR